MIHKHKCESNKLMYIIKSTRLSHSMVLPLNVFSPLTYSHLSVCKSFLIYFLTIVMSKKLLKEHGLNILLRG